MSTSAGDNKELLSALDQLLAKYWDEKEESAREKTTGDKFWGTYLRAMKDEDEARPKDWDGNTGSILTFTGLFAATVAAFVIESYKSLSHDSGDQTVVLLTQLLAASTNSSANPVTSSQAANPFRAPLPAVIANALWFCSLVVALACSLLATLVQQWSRDYVRDIARRESLDETIISRALNHLYIRTGVDRYGMDAVVDLIVALVHLAVILFAAGLLLFLFPINDVVSWCTLSALTVFGLAYLIAGILPIFDTSCPYRTPLTYPLNLACVALCHLFNMRFWTSMVKSFLGYISRWVFAPLKRLRRKAPENDISDIYARDDSESEVESCLDFNIPGTGVPLPDMIQIQSPANLSSTLESNPGLNVILEKFAIVYHILGSLVETGFRRAMPLLSVISTWIWKRLRPLFKRWPSTLSARRKRRVPRGPEMWSSSSRFAFVWQHARHQMLYRDLSSLKILLLSTLDILGAMQDSDTRSAALDHLLNDRRLMHNLNTVPSYGELPDPEMRVAMLKTVCLLMQKTYTRKDVWLVPHDSSHNPDDSPDEWTIRYYLWSLLCIPAPGSSGHGGPIVDDVVAFTLPAFMTLCHFRWFLLLRVHQGADTASDNSDFRVSEFNSLYFTEKSKARDYRWHLFYGHQMLEHPRALLILLNSSLYDPVRSLELPSLRPDEDITMRSCLIPLHDDVCCRRADGPLEHVAACTVLSMIANLLRAPDDARHKLFNDHLRQYSTCWDAGLSFTEWETIFEMSKIDRRRAPSEEFLSVLRDAGLEEWLTPGGNLSYLPPRDAPIGGFLDTYVDLVSPHSFVKFADILRSLTEHVDMSDVRSGLPKSFQWLLQNQGILPSAPTTQDAQGTSESVCTHDAPCSHEATVLNHQYSSRSGGSFELERVVIDTAIGVVSFSPSGNGPFANERSGAHISAGLEGDPSHERQRDDAMPSKQPHSTEADKQDGAQPHECVLLQPDHRTSQQSWAIQAVDAHVERAGTAPAESEPSVLGDEGSGGVRFAVDHVEREEGSTPAE